MVNTYSMLKLITDYTQSRYISLFWYYPMYHISEQDRHGLQKRKGGRNAFQNWNQNLQM